VVAHVFRDVAPIAIETTPSDDLRSYRVNSDRIERELGFRARFTIEDAVRDICRWHRAGRFPGSLTDERYYNVKLLKRQTIPA
jgi:nucleoside-diphosphate-sugar epimerase